MDPHPKSVNAKEVNFTHPWVVYHLKMKSTGVYLYDSSEVSIINLAFISFIYLFYFRSPPCPSSSSEGTSA